MPVNRLVAGRESLRFGGAGRAVGNGRFGAGGAIGATGGLAGVSAAGAAAGLMAGVPWSISNSGAIELTGLIAGTTGACFLVNVGLFAVGEISAISKPPLPSWFFPNGAIAGIDGVDDGRAGGAMIASGVNSGTIGSIVANSGSSGSIITGSTGMTSASAFRLIGSIIAGAMASSLESKSSIS